MAALALIVGAIAARLVALDHAGSGVMAMARSATDSAKRLTLQQLAWSHAHRSDLWTLISLAAAVSAVVCWLASRRTRERGSQSLLLALHGLYVLLLFFLI